MRAHTWMYVTLAILALLAPFLGLYPVFLMKLLCFAMFACAFNLLLGYTKMLSFGHAAYFGSSAYVTGWLVTVHGWGTIEGLLAGVAVSMLLGLLIGALAVRRQGIYFAMITLALSQLVFFICLQADFTGGENGLQGIPRGRLFGVIDLARDRTMYYFVLAAFAGVYVLIRRIVHSPFGQVLKAIRANEPRAISLGYKVDRYKLVAFVLSASFAGLAGALKALVLGFVTLSDVSQGTSGEVILMTLLGGSGTFLGPVVGANIVVTLQEYLSELVGAWVSVIIGAIFVICVMAFRRGFAGEIQQRFADRTGRLGQ
ncbi:MAG: branched-chain amino acid transport system permease protein [Gammaproteobacteria bacterium]|jgi:branched-chain amino acid transport system permease protein|nr:branched-chain amino acid transport system permease protein [Gammaproteobacteria bacterium]